MKLKPVSRGGHYAPIEPANLFASTRGTWLSHLYFRYLKKYRIVRVIAPWLWRKIYLLYQLGWILRKALKLPLLSLLVHTATSSKNVLSKAEIVITPLPEVLPEGAKKYLISPHSEYEFPEIYITQIRNAQVTGGTNLIMTDHSVICHDLYDFSRDFTSEETHWRAYIWPHRRSIAWLTSTVPALELETAACFTDACSPNYAHWMTEVLPRINLFCKSGESTDVPLIINDGLHPNLLETLYAIADGKREIFTLPTGVCARVARLSVTSVTGYVPFERRSNWIKNHSHGRFSPFALLGVRQILQDRLGGPPGRSARRVFVKRNSGMRNIVNADEIEKALVAQGFSVVEPEFLTMSEQVRLFSDVDIVVGATGAAMANLIFCKPTTKIIILISDYKFMPYWYWQNMACAVGNRVTYVLGRCKGSIAYLHSDFKVNISDIYAALD